jgi:hypothetical protein
MKLIPILIALVLLVPMPTPIQAQDIDDSIWVKRTIRKQHRAEWAADRERAAERRRYYARVYGYVRREEEYDRGDRCRDTRRVVGDQGLSVALAQGQADKSWAADVRFHLGERFMDISNAEDVTYECSRSSVGETLGQTFTRCQVSAKPCKASKVEAKR